MFLLFHPPLSSGTLFRTLDIVLKSGLVVHPVPTCADAGPDLWSLHPDLHTLCLRWLSPAATYDGGVSPSNMHTKTPLAPVVVSPIATCARGVLLNVNLLQYKNIVLY